MTTDAARRAAEALNKRREAEGLKRVTVWLSSEARLKLDALKKAAGSKDKVADAAILAWVGPKPVINHMTAVRQIVEGAALSPARVRVETAQGLALGETVGQKIVAAGGRDRLGVQIGPIRAKPGERSKKPKRK
jgi:hypothetical protein